MNQTDQKHVERLQNLLALLRAAHEEAQALSGVPAASWRRVSLATWPGPRYGSPRANADPARERAENLQEADVLPAELEALAWTLNALTSSLCANNLACHADTAAASAVIA